MTSRTETDDVAQGCRSDLRSSSGPGSHGPGRRACGRDREHRGLRLADQYGQVTHPPTTRRVGGGWSSYRSLEVSVYQAPFPGKVHREAAYALRTDGTLHHWLIDNGTWHAAGAYTGFAAVKSMALYTIRLSAGSGAPVVTQVRARTWQGFETLSAMACGHNGTLLVGIDSDTRQAFLYSVGHANGSATLIRSHGRVHGTFDDPCTSAGPRSRSTTPRMAADQQTGPQRPPGTDGSGRPAVIADELAW
ncbi:hypothetical protein AB0E69_33920 [Kribbella sp. NPDC026611]|uniref:hypothetical protein n=1 Tax=Kribbella sp. NPDC026611 TaxID=3154911 RepID=UPI0033DA9C85